MTDKHILYIGDKLGGELMFQYKWVDMMFNVSETIGTKPLYDSVEWWSMLLNNARAELSSGVERVIVRLVIGSDDGVL